ncbi:MAG: O-antigen ligase domain-containing protein, partial [Candidatus Electrothrix sp. AUS1_2]|nr:O-antigen ligase domain-containing protein [Candidatus Electrothrix sp. AUS1_2]
FLAVLQRITAPDTLFWFRELSDGKTAFGPWVYKNHYAGFMVMLCPLVLSQFFRCRPVRKETDTLREKVSAFFSQNTTALYLSWGFGVVVILASVFLTQSRGGIISVLAGVSLFLFLIARQWKWGGSLQLKLPLFVLLLGCSVLVGWYYGWEPVIERFYSIFNGKTGGIQDGRLLIWMDTLRIIKDFPVTGSGFGTFADIFPLYKTIPDDFLYNHAHNDFLELLTDGGLIAGGLGVWLIISVFHAGCRSIRLRKDNVSVLLTAGAFSGLAGLLVYSAFDFNLHNGANGLYCAFLGGLLISSGNTRRYYQDSPTLLTPLKPNCRRKFLISISVLIFPGAILLFHGRIFQAEKYYREARLMSSQEGRNTVDRAGKMAGLLEKAQQIDPVTGLYPYISAKLRKVQGQQQQAILC